VLKKFLKAGFGGVGAQAVNVLSLPIIARLYTPEVYATWAIVMATAGIFGSIACFRYELAIVIPKEEKEASSIFWWCVISAIGMGSIVALLAQMPWLQKFIKTETAGNEWFYSLFASLLVTTMGLTFALQYWNVRQKGYAINSFAQIALVVVTLILQAAWVMKYSASSIGLLIGSLGGQFTAVLLLMIGVIYTGRHPKIAEDILWGMPNIIRSQRRFFLYSTPYTLFGAARARVSVFVIDYFLTSREVGLYAFAHRVMNFPVSLVSNALRPVLFQETATKGVDLLEDKINKILKWMAVITIPFVVLYFFYAKELFILFFGERWAGSGFIGKFLILPVFTFMFCNWMDRIMDVMGKQRLVLILEITFASMSIGGLWIGFVLKLGLNGALLIQCIILIKYNIVYLYIAYDKAGYDKIKLYRLLYQAAIWACICGSLLFILKGLFTEISAILLYFVTIISIFYGLANHFTRSLIRSSWLKKSNDSNSVI
jgi:O-antigen/teichoic acid export membrane protein